MERWPKAVRELIVAMMQERLRRGLTQEQAAPEIGVSALSYNAYECNRNSPPSKLSVAKIVRWLEWSKGQPAPMPGAASALRAKVGRGAYSANV